MSAVTGSISIPVIFFTVRGAGARNSPMPQDGSRTDRTSLPVVAAKAVTAAQMSAATPGGVQ
nr:hypothetical protein GCM10023233_31750 [Brevibacterium otitidis]